MLLQDAVWYNNLPLLSSTLVHCYQYPLLPLTTNKPPLLPITTSNPPITQSITTNNPPLLPITQSITTNNPVHYYHNHMVITSFNTKLLYHRSAIISVICTAFNRSGRDYTFLHWFECKKCNHDVIGYCHSGFYARREK